MVARALAGQFLHRRTPAAFLSIVCFVTFVTFVLSWLIKGESLPDNLCIPLKALSVSAIGNGLSRGMFWSAVLLIDPAQAALINHSWTMLVIIFAALFMGSALSIKHALGILIALAGMLSLVSGASGIASDLTPIHLMALGSAILWAGYTALARHSSVYAGNAVAGGFLTSAIIYFLLALGTGASWDIPPATLALILLAGSAGSAGSYIWDIGRRHGHEQTLGKMALLLPLLSAFWLIAFSRSEPSPQIITGALLMFAAAVIVSPYIKRKNIITLDEDKHQ